MSAFAASGGCSSCPYQGTCHEARKRIQDEAISVGRHYECEFYQSIERSQKGAEQPRRWRPFPKSNAYFGSGC